MVNEFKGTYALILGGSDGLGYASAMKLARHGMNLIIFYRAARIQQSDIDSRFKAIKDCGVTLHAFNADATREDKMTGYMDQVKEALGNSKISVLLHSISKGNLKPLTGEYALNTADFQQTIHSMGLSLNLWTQHLIAADLFADKSQVLSFTSEGSSRPSAGYAAVSAAKATLEILTKSMAVELAPLGIRANCIQAGVTDTFSLSLIPNYEELKAHALERNPFNELTSPEKVAEVVYLLCKEEASWINGTIVKVDGGESLQ
ncbi:MAG: SDR family oxidoreductase [Nonlabens sp.]